MCDRLAHCYRTLPQDYSAAANTVMHRLDCCTISASQVRSIPTNLVLLVSTFQLFDFDCRLDPHRHLFLTSALELVHRVLGLALSSEAIARLSLAPRKLES